MLKGSEVTALRNEANKAKIKGDTDRAIDCLTKICELEPDDANNLKELASLYNKIGKKKRAVEFYWKALEKYREAEYYQNATAIAQMLLRFGEDQLLVKHELAFFYEKQGLLGDAVTAYEELAELYKKEGDIEGVLENLKKIVNITPKKLGIRLKLAEIYENQSRTDDLISELEEIKGIFKEQGRVEEVEAVENKIASLAPDEGVQEEKVEVLEEEVPAPEEKQIPKEVVVEFEQEGIGLLEAVEEGIEEMAEAGAEEAAAEVVAEAAEKLFDMEEEEAEEEEEPEFLRQAAATAEKEEEPEFIQQAAAAAEKAEEPEFIQQAAAAAEKEVETEFLRQAAAAAEEEDIEVSVTGWEDWMNLAELYESVGSIEESAEYYIKAAEANFNKKNYEEAYDIFSKVAELDLSNIICRQKMIQGALKLNSKEKAVESYFSLYECLKSKKADAEAKKILDKIENIDPGSAILGKVRGKKKKKAEEKKVKAGQSLDFEVLFEAEVSEQKAKEEEEMMKAPSLDVLLEEFKNKAKQELDITDYAAHFNLGITYKEMDLYEEAIEEFKKAMQEKSWRLKSLEMLGICHELLGQKEKAEDIYKLVINNKNFREDQKLAFFYHLGNMYAGQDSYADAVEQYKRVIKIDQEFADVKEKIKIVNKKMSGQKVEEEISVHIGDALSEEGADLWDSVLGGGGGEGKEGEEETPSKKQKGKISYI